MNEASVRDCCSDAGPQRWPSGSVDVSHHELPRQGAEQAPTFFHPQTHPLPASPQPLGPSPDTPGHPINLSGSREGVGAAMQVRVRVELLNTPNTLTTGKGRVCFAIFPQFMG
jgi:hypothetical protein